MKDYSKETLVAALEKIKLEYPAVFRNFFLSEIQEKKENSEPSGLAEPCDMG